MNTIQLLEDLVYKEYKKNRNINNYVSMSASSIAKWPLFNYKDEHNDVFAGFEPVLGYIAARMDNSKIDVLEWYDKLVADKIYDDVMRMYYDYIEGNYYI